MRLIYHVFTDGRDSWTEDAQEAWAIYRRFETTYGCARLYREVENDTGETVTEECLASYGPYPC